MNKPMITIASRNNVRQQRNLLVLGAASLIIIGVLVGCHESQLASETAGDAAEFQATASEINAVQDRSAESEPNAETHQDVVSDDGVLEQANDLLQQATSQSSEAAKGAGKWVKNQWDNATEAGEQTAEDTMKWANETYETLKSKGLTTASDTSQWLSQDWRNMESWEYKVLTLGDTDEGLTKTLNNLGKKGWECFHTEVHDDGTRFYFKKPSFSYLRHLPFKDLIKLAPLMQNGEK